VDISVKIGKKEKDAQGSGFASRSFSEGLAQEAGSKPQSLSSN